MTFHHLFFYLLFTVLSLNARGISAAENNEQIVATGRFKQLREVESNLADRKNRDYQNEKARANVMRSQYVLLGFNRSMSGDVFGAIDAFNQIPEHAAPAQAIEFDAIQHGVAEDAITAIVQAAKSRQIVILNEAHHVPMHRAFAMLLARELSKIGYTYMACETFDPARGSPLSHRYVSEASGTFSKESVYGNFLRDALQSNWKFIAYEPEKDPREFNMAKNITDQIFRQDPKAKVFIYAGYGHGMKFPLAQSDDDKSHMAAQLKKLTGLEPLSIDQTVMYEHFDTKAQHDLYRAALARHGKAKPFVLKSAHAGYLKVAMHPAAVDFQVIYPAYTLDKQTQRATWLSRLAGFTARDIPKELLPKTGKRLIYAYHQQDPVDSVPADVIMVEAGKAVPKLMLPPGEFRFAFED